MNRQHIQLRASPAINRRAAQVFVFVFLLFASFAPFGTGAAEQDASRLFSQGLAKESEGDYISAIFIYQDVLSINRYFIDARIALARCYYKTGNLSESENLLLEALRQEKRNIPARNLLSRVYIALKRFDEAEKLLLETLKLEPANIETKYSLADFYRAKKDFSRAVQIYNDVLKLYPQEVWTYIHLGNAYTETGELEKAGGFFRKAVSLDSQNPWTHLNLGRHYFKLGVKYSITDRESSEKFLDASLYEAETAGELAPAADEPHELAASVYFFREQYDRALERYGKIRQNEAKAPLLLYEMGYCAEMLGDLQGAETYYSKALSKRIDDEITRFRLEEAVLSLYRENLSQSARLELSDFHAGKARFSLDKNIADKALVQYRRSVQLDPLNAAKRLELAELFRRKHMDELYLYELRNILRDTLGVDSIDISDRIEIYSNRLEKSLASRWKVEQYEEDEKARGYVPKTRSRVVVFDAFSSDLIKENYIHRRLSLTIREMLSLQLRSYPKVEVIDVIDPVTTPQDALKRSRALEADYYVTGTVEENEDSLKIRLNLLSGFNGRPIKTFDTYFTGNDKVFNSVFALAENINSSLPLRGMIVRMQGNRALINLGEAHGIKKDMAFHIFRRGGMVRNPETGEYSVDTEVSLGKLTVSEVDEMVSEGAYTFTGLHNRVNIYDSVVLVEENPKGEK